MKNILRPLNEVAGAGLCATFAAAALIVAAAATGPVSWGAAALLGVPAAATGKIALDSAPSATKS